MTDLNNIHIESNLISSIDINFRIFMIFLVLALLLYYRYALILDAYVTSDSKVTYKVTIIVINSVTIIVTYYVT